MEAGERRVGDGGRAERSGAGGARKRGRRGARARSICARRRREGWLPERLSHGQGQDGGGRGGICGAAGAGDAGTLCLGGALGAFRPHPGARGSGGRALRSRVVDARHRGRLHRRAGPKASVARGGERDYRAAVGGVRGLFQARSFRAPTSMSTASPNASVRGRNGRQCSPPGASASMGARFCWR